MGDALANRAWRAIAMGGGGSIAGAAVITDAFPRIKIVFVETNPTPTDIYTAKITVTQVETNPVPTEAFTVKVGVVETNPTPTVARSTKVRVWLSGTVATATGVTNPANANGQNDGAVCTIQSALTGTSNPFITSALGSSIGAFTFTSAIYRGWFSTSTTLITSNTRITARSTSALFADVIVFNLNALAGQAIFSDGSFTFDLIAAGINTLAKLQSLQIIHYAADAVAGVTPSVMTVDAGCVELTGVF